MPAAAFWYRACEGTLTAELFVTLLRRMMADRDKPVHVLAGGLAAHKTKRIRDYAASNEGCSPRMSSRATPRTSTRTNWRPQGAAAEGRNARERHRSSTGRHQAPAGTGQLILQSTKCSLYYRLLSHGILNRLAITQKSVIGI